jgi:hypothetical protein
MQRVVSVLKHDKHSQGRAIFAIRTGGCVCPGRHAGVKEAAAAQCQTGLGLACPIEAEYARPYALCMQMCASVVVRLQTWQ